MITGFWGIISAIVAAIVVSFIALLELAVIKALFDGTINLRYLLAEPAEPNAPVGGTSGAPPETPKASLSRFQFLIFTFVIAGIYLVICLETGQLIDIPANVVLLLGVSGGTYAASKGIKTAGDASQAKSEADVSVARGRPADRPD